MPIREATYEQVALEDPEGQWELVCGHLRSKPGMTVEHNHVQIVLTRHLMRQLDERDYLVSMNLTRLRVSTGSYYVPDLCVIPTPIEQQKRQQTPDRLEVYDEPMPLVVEVWSPSTGDYDGGYDVEVKLREYQLRGDAEIWRIHPYEHTLTAWIRQGDGSYAESLHSSGIVRPAALPSVTIELERLFQ